MPIRTILVDDEEFAREELKHQLSIYNNFEICDEAVNGLDAIRKINELKPDLIFMDIEMPGLKGIDVVELIHADDSYSPFIVFVTAYNTFAIDAFKYDVKDYLLKPIDPRRFSLTISKIIKYFEKTSVYEKNIIAKSGSRSTIIKHDDILFISVENTVVSIFASAKFYATTYRTLDEFEKILDPSIFVRTHRTYIINVEKIKEIKQVQSGLLSLKISGYDDKEIPVSRAKVKELKRILKI